MEFGTERRGKRAGDHIRIDPVIHEDPSVDDTANNRQPHDHTFDAVRSPFKTARRRRTVAADPLGPLQLLPVISGLTVALTLRAATVDQPQEANAHQEKHRGCQVLPRRARRLQPHRSGSPTSRYSVAWGGGARRSQNASSTSAARHGDTWRIRCGPGRAATSASGRTDHTTSQQLGRTTMSPVACR